MSKEEESLYKSGGLAYTGDKSKFASQFKGKKRKAEATQWLNDQEAYSVHKRARRKGYQRTKTVVSCIDAQWQADLADVSNISKFNDKKTFLLTVIDVLSRYAWAIPIKDKRGETVADTLEAIFKVSGRQPRYHLQTDEGKEFLNVHMKKLAKRYGFEQFYTADRGTKAAICERFNQTLKTYIYRFLTTEQTHRYIDVLPLLVKGYNARVHSAHGFAPIKVTTANQELVWRALYPQHTDDEEKKIAKDASNLKVGDHVRITKEKGTFVKGYVQNWTREIFVIAERRVKTPRLAFKIKDLNGEDITGTFVSEQLQKVNTPDSYLVEKVVRRRKKKGGKKEVLIKWLGYPESMNSWIPEKDLKDR